MAWRNVIDFIFGSGRDLSWCDPRGFARVFSRVPARCRRWSPKPTAASEPEIECRYKCMQHVFKILRKSHYPGAACASVGAITRTRAGDLAIVAKFFTVPELS